MTMHRFKLVALAVAVSLGALMGTMGVHANSVDAILKVGQTKTAEAKQSQEKIDKLAGETNDLLSDYKTVNKQIDGLKVYNTRLERQLANQMKRIQDIEESIDQVTVIQRQMLPLVIRMIEGLEQFVALDVPFFLDERKQRIEFLRNNVDRSDLSVAEKFRQVLEAYKIENEFGRKIGEYTGKVNIDGVDRDVNFLQIGRVALLYQTTDTEVSGMWNKETRQFEQLDKSAYRGAIQKGLRIARKQASIEVLKVPVSAPEAVN